MKRELRDEWVKRLRSGEYRQGMGALCVVHEDDDGYEPSTRYCCLGVLCEIGVERGRVRMIDNRGQQDYHSAGVDDTTCLYVPAVWNAQEAGLETLIAADDLPERFLNLTEDWDGTESTIQAVLASANDSGRDFGEIADLIEAIVPVED